MEFTLVDALCSLGVGGVFALVMFQVYRMEHKRNLEQIRADRKFMEDRLTKIIESDQKSRELNTTALTKLTETIDKIFDRANLH